MVSEEACLKIQDNRVTILAISQCAVGAETLELQTTRSNDTDLWARDGRWFFSALWDPQKNLVDLLVDLPQQEALAAKQCYFTDVAHGSLSSTVEAFRMREWDTTDCYRMRCRLSSVRRASVNLSHAKVTLVFKGSFSRLLLPPKPVEAMLPRLGSLAACVGPIFRPRRYVSMQDYFTYYSKLGVQQFFVYIFAGQESQLNNTYENVTWVLYEANPSRFYSGQVPMMQDLSCLEVS